MRSIHRSPGLVTVVIPFFNREHCLRRTIDSVVAQTYTNWEIVLVDDGSTDRSFEIATEYAERFPGWIRVFRQQNQGVAAARNRAIAEARGAFIALLDSDDEWDARFLERTVAAFELGPDVDWVYVNARRVDEEGNVLVGSVFDDATSGDFRRLRTRKRRHLLVIEDPDFLVTTIASTVKVGANSVVRREVFGKVSYPVGIHVGEDRALVIEAVASGLRFGYVDEVLLTVYHHGANTSLAEAASVTKALRGQLEMIRAYEHVDRHVELDAEARRALKEKLGELYFHYAAALLDARRAYLTLARYLAKSIAVRPRKNPIVTAVGNRLRRRLRMRG